MLLGGLILSCPTRRRRGRERHAVQHKYYRRCGKGDSGEGARCGLLGGLLGKSSDPWSASSSSPSLAWRYRLRRGPHGASETSLLSRWSKGSATSRDTTSRTDESVDHPLVPPTGSRCRMGQRPSAAMPLVEQPIALDSLPLTPPDPSPPPPPWVPTAVAQDVLFPIDAIEFFAVVGSRSRARSSIGCGAAATDAGNDDDGASLGESKATAPSVVSHLGMEDPIAALAPVRLWAIPSNAADAPDSVDFDFDPRRSNLRLLCGEPAQPAPEATPPAPLSPSADRRRAAVDSVTAPSTPDIRNPMPKQPKVGVAAMVELELPPLALERSSSRILPLRLHKSTRPLEVPLGGSPSVQTPPPRSRRKVRIRVRLQGGCSRAVGDAGTTGVDWSLQQQQRRVAESVVAELLRYCRAHQVQAEVILEAGPGPAAHELHPRSTAVDDDDGVHTAGSEIAQHPNQSGGGPVACLQQGS